MAAGAYTVAWRTMAKDGHVARGTFAFKIGAAPANCALGAARRARGA